MGGVHASMRLDEALEHVDAVVQGEAESVWRQVLEDVRQGALQRLYVGAHADMDQVPAIADKAFYLDRRKRLSNADHANIRKFQRTGSA